MGNREVLKEQYIPERDKFIIDLCKDKKVLHIGASDWPYTKEKIEKGNHLYCLLDTVVRKQTGIDLDQESVDMLNSLDLKRSKVSILDMNKISKGVFEENFDIVLFTETIEHVTNPGIALENIKQAMNRDTTLVITTPNANSLGYVRNIVIGKEGQHPDHKLCFTYKTLTQLLVAEGFSVTKNYFTFLSNPNPYKNLNWKGRLDYRLRRLISKHFPIAAPTLVFLAKKNQ